MARTKFLEKGICKDIPESLEKLLTEYLIPNSPCKFEWQYWREEELWNLEVDDLLKANLNGLKALYHKFG